MTVVILDTGSGNLRSVHKALEAAGAARAVIASTPDALMQAERIVMPGQGAFADTMAGLARTGGLTEALKEAVIDRGVPFLGICVGMQVLADKGFEHGEHAGLGLIGGTVERLSPADAALKIPHMGWNSLTVRRAHPLFAGIADGSDVYFVHSYHLRLADPAHGIAETDYGGPVTAAVGRDNLAATQFHPEKSQAVGLKLLANFLDWRP